MTFDPSASLCLTDRTLAGVSLRARNFGKGIRAGLNGIGSGPRQIQNLLARLQNRIYEERLAALLQARMDFNTSSWKGCLVVILNATGPIVSHVSDLKSTFRAGRAVH